MCCVEYSVCTDANSFTLDAPEDPAQADSGKACAVPAAAADTAAKEDYIEIQGSGPTCGQTSTSYYCAQNLNTLATAELSVAICDCGPPFEVRFVTNAIAEAKSATAGVFNRGVCLEYRQLPCTSSNSNNS